MPLPATAPGAMRQHRLRDRIEVGNVIVLLRERRAVLPAQAKVQSEVGKNLPVVLSVGAIQGLAQVDYEVVGQLIAAGETEQEVRPVVVGDLGGSW